jgi:hypothetical protein
MEAQQMGSIGTILAQTANVTVLSAERLLAGITPQSFARFARPGGVELHSNHPAFVLGHLSLYPAKVLAHLGRDAGDVTPPAKYEDLFKNGVECRDDPAGTIYPSMAELRDFFLRSYRAAIASLTEADDARLAGPNPSEGRMKELFPSLGAMLNFYLSGHAHAHLGQLSAWRRAQGLPPA